MSVTIQKKQAKASRNTSIDVAKLAGVSQATVSRAFNPVSYTHLDVYKRQAEYILLTVYFHPVRQAHTSVSGFCKDFASR